MKYIIIGLGNYGSVLAEELTLLGHEVIGVDSNENKVDAVKDKITTAMCLDAADELAMDQLPLGSVDVVIVAIGKNLGASVRVVALLKKNKVKKIYARAVDDVHKTVMEAFKLDGILNPEKDAARSFVKLLELNVHVETLKIDKEYYVTKFKIPASFVGFKVMDTALEKQFNLKIIALVKSGRALNSAGISIIDRNVDNSFDENYTLEAEDKLVCYGTYKNFMAFWKAL